MAGSLTVATGEAVLQIYEANADTIQLSITLSMDWPNETKRQLLAQCCRLSDKNSCDISRDIWNLSQYFKKCFCTFHDLSRNPERHAAECWLGNGVLEEQNIIVQNVH
jgi:hypothetical protein